MSYLEKHREEIFKKYSNEELVKDINSYKNGSGNLNKTLNHFFEELIWESCGKRTKISPMNALKDDDFMEEVLKYIESKPKFFTSNEISNVKSYFRNSSSKVRKVANFNPKTARDIYFRYNDINGKRLNILDTSSGFGSRMSSVVLSGHNYYGFDPNIKLNRKLNEYKTFLLNNDLIDNSLNIELICDGSEVYYDELKGIIDVSFTSPPYFNLETYSNDSNQSSKNYDNYNKWIELFAKPTIINTYKYLKIGGHAMINIKNISKKEPIYDDFIKLFNDIEGFKYIETFDMKIAKKNYGMAKGVGDIKNSEPIMVFKKIK